MNRFLFSLFSSLLLSCMFAPAALASALFFNDRAAFQSAAGSLVTESLDTIMPGISTTQPTGVTLTGGANTGTFAQESNPVFISEGTGSLQVAFWNSNASIIFDFDTPISAFGVDFLDDAPIPFDMDLSIGLTGAPQSFGSSQIQTANINGPLFMGVLDTMTPFNQVVITSKVTENPFVNFDFIQFEIAAVPIPATFWLFGAGLLGLIGIARRK